MIIMPRMRRRQIAIKRAPHSTAVSVRSFAGKMSLSLKRRYAQIGVIVLSLLGTSVAAAQSASITGKVRERGGKSLEGVNVRATRATDEAQKVEAKSNQKGEFQLAGLAPGEYVLSFERSGFRTFTTKRLPVAAGETVKLRNEIELAPENPPFSLIRGAVFTAEGFSLPNASVRIERLGEGKRFKRETVSVEGGEFGFRLPPEKATYRITATARGFETATKDIEVDADDVRQVALTLERSK